MWSEFKTEIINEEKRIMNNSGNSGIGVLGTLGVAFVILKLMDIIDWPWWAVTIPFWGGIALIACILITYFFVTIILNKIKSTNRNK